MSAFQPFGGDEKCVSRLRWTGGGGSTSWPGERCPGGSPPRPERQLSRQDLSLCPPTPPMGRSREQLAAGSSPTPKAVTSGGEAEPAWGESVTHFATFSLCLQKSESFQGLRPRGRATFGGSFREFRAQHPAVGRATPPAPAITPEIPANIAQTQRGSGGAVCAVE